MRFPDWPERLEAEIERHRKVPFSYGAADCFVFVADCVRAMTGDDPAAKVRGKYKTERGAASQMRKVFGAADVAGLLASLYAEIPPAMARRGDLGIVESDRGPVSCVIGGPQIFAKSRAGVLVAPRGQLAKAFRVD